MGDTRNPSALSLEERNFVEVGTFQPSLGFKDFHQAAEREMCPWAISKCFGDLVSNTSA